MKYYTHACSCIILMFYTTFGGPSWFLPLVIKKVFKGFLFLLAAYFFRNSA